MLWLWLFLILIIFSKHYSSDSQGQRAYIRVGILLLFVVWTECCAICVIDSDDLDTGEVINREKDRGERSAQQE